MSKVKTHGATKRALRPKAPRSELNKPVTVRTPESGDLEVKGLGTLKAPVEAGERFEVPADFKPKLVDQTAECMHWWRLTGNKGVCKKCGATRIFGKTEQATEEAREAILAYVQAHNGKKIEWKAFGKEVKVPLSRLGYVLRAMIDEGAVVQPDSGAFVYRLPGKTKAQAKLPKAVRRAA